MHWLLTNRFGTRHWPIGAHFAATGAIVTTAALLMLWVWPIMDGYPGTVNLIGSGCDKAHEGRSHERLCPSGHAGDLGPGLEGLGSGGSILMGGAVIAAEVEEVVDLIVGGEEALSLSG
jgi:hypothetical protein